MPVCAQWALHLPPCVDVCILFCLCLGIDGELFTRYEKRIFLVFLPVIVEKAIAACLGGAQTGGDGDLWQHGLIAQAMHRYNSVQSVSSLRCGEIFYQL